MLSTELSKGFWRWCVTLITTGFLDFVSLFIEFRTMDKVQKSSSNVYWTFVNSDPGKEWSHPERSVELSETITHCLKPGSYFASLLEQWSTLRIERDLSLDIITKKFVELSNISFDHSSLRNVYLRLVTNISKAMEAYISFRVACVRLCWP
jgi:hypothetical protein